MSEDEHKRYVPPHKRNEASSRSKQPIRQQKPSSHHRQQRYRPTPRENEYNFDGHKFTVTLKTSKTYEKDDLPVGDYEHSQAESGRQSYKFQVVFQEDNIRDLMRVSNYL